MKTIAKLCFALVIGLSSVATAQEATGPAGVTVQDPWARATIGASRPGGAYLTLRNDGNVPISLTGLRAYIAGMVSIHETSTTADGVSSMSPAGDLEIPVGGTLELTPGSYHAMLMRLKEPLVKGNTFPMVLLFSDGTELEIEVPVLGVGARGPGD